jgi:hypothetical protein
MGWMMVGTTCGTCRIERCAFVTIESIWLLQRRCRGSDNSIVTSINDVHNGLFINANIHCVLGLSVAFLKVSLFDLVLHLVGS